MISKTIIDRVTDQPEAAEVLFKPVQLRIIEKLAEGAPLNDNEKRYLRGNLGKKITALDRLLHDNDKGSTAPHPILTTMSNYYVTGHEALRQNGFGWFYDANTITVMNTSLKGSIRHDGRKFNFIRVRSMKRRSKVRDPSTGIFYATNEQIIKDAFELKDESLKRTWRSMLERYGTMFVDSPEQYYSTKYKETHEEGGLLGRGTQGGPENIPE